jgi:hypothetical protein
MVFSRFPAYSAVSGVRLPQTACKYREQAAYEVVLRVRSAVVALPLKARRVKAIVDDAGRKNLAPFDPVEFVEAHRHKRDLSQPSLNFKNPYQNATVVLV